MTHEIARNAQLLNIKGRPRTPPIDPKQPLAALRAAQPA